jgi:hypothetical protein
MATVAVPKGVNKRRHHEALLPGTRRQIRLHRVGRRAALERLRRTKAACVRYRTDPARLSYVGCSPNENCETPMIATGDDLDAALVAVALLVGVLVENDPRREELLKSFRMSLEGLEEEPTWRDVAIRAKIHGETMLANMQMQTSSAPKQILSKLRTVLATARPQVIHLNAIKRVPEQADESVELRLTPQ